MCTITHDSHLAGPNILVRYSHFNEISSNKLCIDKRKRKIKSKHVQRSTLARVEIILYVGALEWFVYLLIFNAFLLNHCFLVHECVFRKPIWFDWFSHIFSYHTSIDDSIINVFGLLSTPSSNINSSVRIRSEAVHMKKKKMLNAYAFSNMMSILVYITNWIRTSVNTEMNEYV